MEKLKSGEVKYDLIEVMACPGGCIGGAGQPIAATTDIKKARAKGLYNADKLSQMRKSQDNPVVAKFYEKWLKKPNSDEAHRSLHTKYATRARIMGEDIEILKCEQENKMDIAVCVGTCCYLKGSYDTLKELTRRAEEAGIKERVNLHATFCLEGCKQSPTIRINEEIINGVSSEKVAGIFKTKVLDKLTTVKS
jgi:NADH:ubiquinone oxidoreductase subunit E